MNAEKALRKVRKLSKELRHEHAENLLTNSNLSLDQVRYAQAYINALDWIEIQFVAVFEDKEEDNDEL